MNDELSIKVGGRTLSGWTTERVTRGVERVVSDFEVAMTEHYPGAGLAEVRPGDPCEIYAGSDLLITGYVDRYIPEFDAHQHSIRIAGRSKTADIVDCSAEWPGSQIMNGTVLSIAQTLCKPYGINAIALTDVGATIPQTNLNVGDTPFDVLEPMARYRGLLMYDNTMGNLVFSSVGTTKAASGFTEGINVESAGMAYAMDSRYSKYSAFRVKLMVLNDSGTEGNFISDVNDTDVPRHRWKSLVAETQDGGIDVAQRRAAWEMTRRKGRSAQVHLIADGWRDSNGVLWTPNTLASVSLPTLKLANVDWLISEVTYLRNGQGTHAQVTLMHPNSFVPQPFNYQPFPNDVAEALAKARK